MPSSTELTHFDGAGLTRIEQTGVLRFDLRDHELLAKDVRLPEDTMGPQVGGASKPVLSLELLGPDGTFTAKTRTFMPIFNRTDGVADGVTWWEDFDSIEAAHDRLREQVKTMGLQQSAVNRWIKDSAGEPAADSYSKSYDRVIGGGVGQSGLVFEVEASLTKDSELHRCAVYLYDEYYAAETLDEIRKTGILPIGDAVG